MRSAKHKFNMSSSKPSKLCAKNKLLYFVCIFQAQTILKICDYVKKNPRASQAQLKAEVEKEITAFAQQVSQL